MIVSWSKAYCYKCQKQFKSRQSLLMHLFRSKNHNKKFLAEQEQKEKDFKNKHLSLERFFEEINENDEQ